jgi:hypothetical protein
MVPGRRHAGREPAIGVMGQLEAIANLHLTCPRRVLFDS